MTAELIERPLFPTPPGEELAQAFRRHVFETGQPETFSQISTSRPPKDGRIEVLDHPIDINPQKRPDGWRAPCPICSPSAGRFLLGGTLIWCEATKAIYAIGPDCSHTLWTDGRLDKAVNIFRQSQAAKQVALDLAHEAEAVPSRRGWIAKHRTAVERISQV